MSWAKVYALIEAEREKYGDEGQDCDKCHGRTICVKAWCHEMDGWQDASRGALNAVYWTFPCGRKIMGKDLP